MPPAGARRRRRSTPSRSASPLLTATRFADLALSTSRRRAAQCRRRPRCSRPHAGLARLPRRLTRVGWRLFLDAADLRDADLLAAKGPIA
jgi:hypothetical protein